MAITIIGLPWARAAFSIAAYTLLPFGYKAVPRDEYFGREDVGTGPLGAIGNIVWLIGARPPHHGDPARRDHRGNPFRLGTPEARRAGAVADREGDRPGAERAAPLAAASLGSPSVPAARAFSQARCLLLHWNVTTALPSVDKSASVGREH